MKFGRQFTQLICFVLLFCFSSNSIAWSESVNITVFERKPNLWTSLLLPAKVGRIEEVFLPQNFNSNSKLVIYLRDAHANLGAQENIARITHHLGARLNIQAILAEGGSSEIDLSSLRNFPDQRIKEKVADFWMKESVLDGIEKEAIVGDRSYRLFGIENEGAYQEGVDRFRKTHLYSKSFLNSLAVLFQKNYEQRKKDFNPRLFSFEELVSKFEEKHELIAWVGLVANEARNLHLNRWKYLEIQKFVDLILLEFEGASPERFLQIQKTIDAPKLFSELQSLKSEIKENLFETKKERILDKEHQILECLRSLASLEAVPSEYHFFIKHRGLIFKYLTKVKLDLSTVKNADEFYRSALWRDESLFENVQNILNSKGISRVFLVTGGFHSEGITENLRKNNIPFVLISPQISEEENFERYLARIAGEKATLDQFVEKNPDLISSTINDSLVSQAEVATIRTSFDLALRNAETKRQTVRAEVRKEESALLEGVNERTPDWQRMNILMHILMRIDKSNTEKIIPLHMALSESVNALKNYGLGVSDEHILRLFDRLEKIGLIQKQDSSFRLAQPPRKLAVKTDNAFYIKQDIEEALQLLERGSEEVLANLVLEYSDVTQLWPQATLEARWPVLRAVTLLSKENKQALVEFLKSQPALRRLVLVDNILSMLKAQSFDDWLSESAPHIVGRNIFYISPETFLQAGGLGRVGVFHTSAAKKLTGQSATLITIEPKYRYRLMSDGSEAPIDYSKLVTPVMNLQPKYEFETEVQGIKVQTVVYEGYTLEGIKTYLIDGGEYYTRYLYRYGYDVDSGRKFATYDEFLEFFARASLELVARIEEEKQQTEGNQYKAGVLWANDGQSALIPAYKRLLEGRRTIFRRIYVHMTTHTYRNRGTIKKLVQMGFVGFQRLFERVWFLDATSGGVRTADSANGVSLIHAIEVDPLDPHIKIDAITNGDQRRVSSAVFRSILNQLFPEVDPEEPSPDEIIAERIVANNKLNDLLKTKFGINADLNPNQPVISYAGRFVSEKSGLKRAFTKGNLRELVTNDKLRELVTNEKMGDQLKALAESQNLPQLLTDERIRNLIRDKKMGAQVVYFANIQDKSDSGFEELQKLAQEINEQGPGKLIVVTGWNMDDQKVLNARSDLQMQDSDRDPERGTGAAEFTESDVSTNGGLQMGPPWIEGIIQRQGIVLDRTIPGSGNTLIPASENPDDYLKTLYWALVTYHTDKEYYFSYGSTSIKLSRILEAELPSSEYLRRIDRGVRQKDNLMDLVDKVNEAFSGKILDTVPQELSDRLAKIAQYNPEQAAVEFGESKVPAVMALIAILRPELLNSVQDWNHDAYQRLNATLLHPQLKPLFEQSFIRLLPNTNSEVVVVTRLQNPEVKGGPNVIFPIHLGLVPWNVANGKVWVTVTDVDGIVKNSDSIRYQVTDYSLNLETPIVYPAQRKGSTLVNEKWRVGITVIPNVRDDSGYIQHGLHFQALVMNELSRAETRAVVPAAGPVGYGFSIVEAFRSLSFNTSWFRTLVGFPMSVARPLSRQEVRNAEQRREMISYIARIRRELSQTDKKITETKSARSQRTDYTRRKSDGARRPLLAKVLGKEQGVIADLRMESSNVSVDFGNGSQVSIYAPIRDHAEALVSKPVSFNSAVRVNQKSKMVVTLEALKESEEIRAQLISVLESNRDNDLLEVAIFAPEYKNELQAEGPILNLFDGRNLFTEFKPVQLYARKRMNIFDSQISKHAILSRLVELKRREIQASGFSTRTVVIAEKAILSKLLRQDTPKLLARPEAVEAALLLFQLDGTIDWRKIAPQGFLDPTRSFVNMLQQVVLGRLKLTTSA